MFFPILLSFVIVCYGILHYITVYKTKRITILHYIALAYVLLCSVLLHYNYSQRIMLYSMNYMILHGFLDKAERRIVPEGKELRHGPGRSVDEVHGSS